MTEKRFYIPLILIIFTSVIILSVSYSKKSGTNIYERNSYTENNLQVIYDKKTNIENNIVDSLNEYKNLEYYKFNIINTSNQKINYVIKLTCNNCYNSNYYFALDDYKPQVIKKEYIFLGQLEKYGSNKDQEYHTIKLLSLKDQTKFNIEIIKTNLNTLEDIIKYDEYSSKQGNNYYLDLNQIKYIKYDNQLYQILGLLENDTCILKNIQDNNLINVDKNIQIIKGNGQINTPFEVKNES